MNENTSDEVSKSSPDQSDIYSGISFSALDRELFGILMTPVCDISQNKVSYFTFCAVLPFDILFYEQINTKFNVSESQFKSKETPLSKGKTKEIISFIKEFINGSWNRYHWIGDIPGDKGYWYVDFQLTECILKQNFESGDSKKIISLISPNKEAVFTRYSNFLGRVGLVGEEEERTKLAEKIIDEFKNSID